MRNIIIFAIIGLLLFGCINPPPSGNNTTYTPPVMTAPNGTAQSNVTTPAANQSPSQNQSQQALPSNYTVNLGDKISVIYSLYVDGALYDTNNATLANESGMYNPNRKYVPLNFTAQIGSGMIDGFVINVVGIKVNETISFRVDPARGYGPYDTGKVITVPRYYIKNFSEVVPRSYFTERHLNVSNGTSYETPYGLVFIQDFNDENVTLFYSSLIASGYKFTYSGIPNEVVNSTAEYATVERMLDVNRTYVVADPRTGQAARYLVISKTDQNITLDGNHPLANKSLDFTVTLLGVKPAPHD